MKIEHQTRGKAPAVFHFELSAGGQRSQVQLAVPTILRPLWDEYSQLELPEVRHPVISSQASLLIPHLQSCFSEIEVYSLGTDGAEAWQK